MPGPRKRLRVDARLITASSRPLKVLLGEGLFLPALQRRLAGMVIEAPALRARKEDIPLMIRNAFDVASQGHGGGRVEISRNAVNLLVAYDWPGNVRELRNVVEGMVATSRPGEVLGVLDLPSYLRRATAPDAGEIRIPAGTPMREIERIAIEETMRLHGYHKEKCAKALGIGLRTLYRKLKEFGIR